jgi:hypothetical protein
MLEVVTKPPKAVVETKNELQKSVKLGTAPSATVFRYGNAVKPLSLMDDVCWRSICRLTLTSG